MEQVYPSRNLRRQGHTFYRTDLLLSGRRNRQGLLRLVIVTAGILAGLSSFSLAISVEPDVTASGQDEFGSVNAYGLSWPMPGDANGDGYVGAGDLAMLLGSWNLSGPSGMEGDLDGDGYVGASDYTVVLTYWDTLWDTSPSPAPHAPEPLSLFGVGMGLVGLARYGQKRLSIWREQLG